MTLALCGCPNCGKTTLFNLLTGQSQRTGNWPGVTVQLCRGRISPAFLPDVLAPVTLIDLPGAKSLTPFSPDEAVMLRLLRQSPPDALIVVIDSCDPAQGLYLTLQLLSLRLPVVLALNMADRLQTQGGCVHLSRLSHALHIPCVLISARKHTQIQTLLHTALQAKPSPYPPPDASWHTVDQLLQRCFQLPQSPFLTRLDRLCLHPFFAYPLLLVSFFLVFFCTFGPVGQTLSALLNTFFQYSLQRVSSFLSAAGTPAVLHALLTDGLFRSMGSVLSFLPVLLVFFFCTALMEDSGYLARAAFLLDAPLCRLRLSGRSFFPLVTGFGCSVPAVLSLRALPSADERRCASLLIPLIPCSAKLPVLLFISACCFQTAPLLPVALCYALCLLLLLLTAACLPRKGAAPLLMDFPPLRVPTLRGALHAMQNKTRDFIVRAFTVIFFTSALVWLLQSFTPAFTFTRNARESLLFQIGSLFLPLLAPLGLDSPLHAAALLSGLLAKENILSVLALSSASSLFSTPASALSFLTFSLLYAPCASACAALSQAYKSRRRMLCSVLLQTAFAWLAALIVYRLSR